MANSYGRWPIFGHEKQVGLLQQALEADRLAHAYLFYGLTGLGKKLLVKCLLRQIFCSNQKVSCHDCASCLQLEQRQHPDVVWLPTAGATSITVDDIRFVLSFVSRSATTSKGYKAVVIERADYLTNEAANALLKILEEAPPHVIFFLLAQHVNQVPTTVRSRCSLIKLLPLPEAAMRTWLKEFSLTSEQEDTLVHVAMGRPGRALELMADSLSGYQQRVKRGLSVLEQSVASNFSQLKDLLATWQDTSQQSGLNSVGFSLEELNYIELVIRDLLLSKVNSSFILNSYMSDELRRAAAKFSVANLLQLMAALKQLRYTIQHNANISLAWEYFFLQINDLKQIA